MANSFQRVNHTLRADRGLRSTWFLLSSLLLLSLWLAWALYARITRYEISQNARIEADSASSALRVVARFPSSALCELRTGQSAYVQLQGFPGTAGMLRGRVSRVPLDVRGGNVTVALTLDPTGQLPISLQPGLPATVGVEIERVSPIALLLRWSREMVTAH